MLLNIVNIEQYQGVNWLSGWKNKELCLLLYYLHPELLKMLTIFVWIRFLQNLNI